MTISAMRSPGSQPTFSGKLLAENEDDVYADLQKSYAAVHTEVMQMAYF